MKNEPVKRSKIKSKSYRIHERYFFLLETCIQLYGDLKTELFLTLLKTGKLTDSERFLALPQYNKNEFIESILKNLERIGQPIEDLIRMLENPKVIQIQNYYNEIFPGEKNKSVLLQTRIEPIYQEFIESYSDDRIGEVIELAIANFINEVSDFEFELIGFLFESKVDKALNEKYSRELPFDTHTIYLQYNDQYFKLNRNLNKEPVEKIKKHSPKYPSILLDSNDFNQVKKQLLNKKNPHCLSNAAVKFYHEIGFITDEEYSEFNKK